MAVLKAVVGTVEEFVYPVYTSADSINMVVFIVSFNQII